MDNAAYRIGISYSRGHVVVHNIPEGCRWMVAAGHYGNFYDMPYETGESRFASVPVPPGPFTVRVRGKRNGYFLNMKDAELTVDKIGSGGVAWPIYEEAAV